MTVVVPPQAAARVPVSKSSAMRTGGAMGWSRWQWASTPPGVTTRPAASISVLPAPSEVPNCTMRPPVMPMSASKVSLAVATRARRTTKSNAVLTFGHPAHQRWAQILYRMATWLLTL